MSNNVKPIAMDPLLADVSSPLYCLQNFGAKTIISHGLTGTEVISIEIKWGAGGNDFEQATDENGDDLTLTALKRTTTIYGPAIIRLSKPITASATTVSYIDSKGM